jgi:hypothetical protein
MKGNGESIDYDVHGLVGIRLINPSEGDAAAVAKQLGPLRAPLTREPDIVVRFVEHLPTPQLNYLGLNTVGYNHDEFFILKSGRKKARVKIAFDQIGGKCEIVCERGLPSVPLLLAIINLTLLKKNVVGLHASAFVYNGTGILVTGWAKGGKTEALLAFAAKGAKYIGDEWIFLSEDGQTMYGIPENIRLWDWHLDHFSHLKSQLSREKRYLFKLVHVLDSFERKLGNGKMGKTFLVKFLREAMPALKRQLNVQLPPKVIFNGFFDSFSARVGKVFLLMSHKDAKCTIEKTDPLEIARKMVASIQFELMPFMEHYLAYKFAFPEKSNNFIERAHELQFELLTRALAGKEAYTVWHPYPVFFAELFEAMRPYCEKSVAKRHLHNAYSS